MKINIISKSQVKKILIDETGKEFAKINNSLDILNERVMRLEDEFKCIIKIMENKK